MGVLPQDTTQVAPCLFVRDIRFSALREMHNKLVWNIEKVLSAYRLSLSLLRSLNPYCPSLSVCSVTLREIDRKSNLSEGINCSLTFCISFPLFRSLYPSFSIFSFIFFSVFSFSFCGFLAACFACKFLT